MNRSRAEIAQLRNLSYKKEEKDDLFKWKTGRYSGGDFSCRTCRERQYCLDYIAAELNGEIVPKQQYKDTILRSGDKLEIVSFVGGG